MRVENCDNYIMYIYKNLSVICKNPRGPGPTTMPKLFLLAKMDALEGYGLQMQNGRVSATTVGCKSCKARRKLYSLIQIHNQEKTPIKKIRF